jgi:hypothetical protein
MVNIAAERGAMPRRIARTFGLRRCVVNFTSARATEKTR